MNKKKNALASRMWVMFILGACSYYFIESFFFDGLGLKGAVVWVKNHWNDTSQWEWVVLIFIVGVVALRNIYKAEKLLDEPKIHVSQDERDIWKKYIGRKVNE